MSWASYVKMSGVGYTEQAAQRLTLDGWTLLYSGAKSAIFARPKLVPDEGGQRARFDDAPLFSELLSYRYITLAQLH